jgi:serine/threonine protein phosphatase 1
MIKPHKKVKLNKGQLAYFCGDLHGDLSALERAIKHSGFVEGEDNLFLMGDIIDRGPDSAELIEYATCTPGVYSVIGNHEQMFLEALVDPLVRQV